MKKSIGYITVEELDRLFRAQLEKEEDEAAIRECLVATGQAQPLNHVMMAELDATLDMLVGQALPPETVADVAAEGTAEKARKEVATVQNHSGQEVSAAQANEEAVVKQRPAEHVAEKAEAARVGAAQPKVKDEHVDERAAALTIAQQEEANVRKVAEKALARAKAMRAARAALERRYKDHEKVLKHRQGIGEFTPVWESWRAAASKAEADLVGLRKQIATVVMVHTRLLQEAQGAARKLMELNGRLQVLQGTPGGPLASEELHTSKLLDRVDQLKK
eukprot:jgi/Mesen1/7556/ME000392S06819